MSRYDELNEVVKQVQNCVAYGEQPTKQEILLGLIAISLASIVATLEDIRDSLQAGDV